MVLMFVVAAIMAADNTDYGSSGIEIVEVFRAETTEELEAALRDGYPMPWLDEILSDESIPEEDRYWLDCRVRAVIAQDLHLFFDEEGNPVHIEADWIIPGEDYWRENFIVNPIGEPFIYDSPDMPTHVRSEPGYIVNRFGEAIGQLAMVDREIRLSRDGAIGVTCSDVQLEGIVTATSRATNVCILYPDGSFKEIKIGYSNQGNYAISSDGNTIVAASYLPTDSTEYPEEGGILWILDRNGNIRSRFETSTHPSNTPPAVSANGKYIAYAQYPSPHPGLFLLDGVTGELLYQFEDDIMGHYLCVTPNERYLCIGGYERPLIFDCENLSEVWSIELIEDFRNNSFTNCDNSAQLIAVLMICSSGSGTPAVYEMHLYSIDESDPIIIDTTRNTAILSLNGSFAVSYSSIYYNQQSIPLIVNRINRGE